MLNNTGRFIFTPIKALIFLNSHPNKAFIMSYKKINIITGWVVFLIATIVYLLTTEETTSLWDCGEYITTANKLEVGHPPGAPFFMMLGRLFSAFSSPENAAYMVNVTVCLI